jgi:4-hydroxyphenylacetate 3-monooxygenase oxygenase component
MMNHPTTGSAKERAMGLRTADAFLQALRDERAVWLDGERVKDVTTDPRLRAAALTIAELYAMQHRPELRDRLSFVLDDGGERVGYSHVLARTVDDLRRRREMIKCWADENGGMLGRTPDFMNLMVAGYAAAHEFFAQGGRQFGDNIRRYHDRVRREDLCLTHTLIHPQRDRSTVTPVAGDEENAARVVRETDAGAVIRGARMLATLAPFADELAVVPSISRFPPDSEEAKPFAFAFCLPMATPGLRFICRKSLTPPGARVIDYPLSARLDEMDCVAVFDDVLVPWERFFIYRNPRLVASILQAAGPALVQSAIKDLAKAEFLTGLAYNLAESINVLQFPNVQNNIREMVTVTEMVRAAVVASESEPVPGPDGTILPNPRYIRQERFYFLEAFPRLLEIIRTLGAGGLMMTPGEAEVRGPLSADVDRYYQAAALPAGRRIELFALALDAACSGFAGRNALYEQFFAGDPWRLGALAAASYPLRDELKARTWEFLERSRRWDERLGGKAG